MTNFVYSKELAYKGRRMPTALGCQVFAGGFTLGVREHFEVLDQLESSKFGSATARDNLGLPVPEHEDDWQPKRFEGVDFVYANPPCQIWSVYRRANWDRYVDGSVEMHRSVSRLVDSVRPAFYAVESVPQVVTKGAAHVDSLRRWASENDYALTILHLDGKMCGLPQRRRRVFLVFHRYAFNPRPPSGTRVTVGECLAAVDDPGVVAELPTGWLDVINFVEPGTKLRPAWEALDEQPAIRMKFRLGDIVLNPEQAAPTTLGFWYPNFVRWDYPRRFVGHLEVAAICGYPLWYKWPRTASKAVLEMTRAVCPQPASYLAGEVAKALEAREPLPYDWAVPKVIDYRPATMKIDDYEISPKRGPWFANFGSVEEQQGIEYAGVE